jgi:hypothetical protein
MVCMGCRARVLGVVGFHHFHRREEGPGRHGRSSSGGRGYFDWPCRTEQEAGKDGEAGRPEDAVQVIGLRSDLLQTLLLAVAGRAISATRQHPGELAKEIYFALQTSKDRTSDFNRRQG